MRVLECCLSRVSSTVLERDCDILKSVSVRRDLNMPAGKLNLFFSDLMEIECGHLMFFSG